MKSKRLLVHALAGLLLLCGSAAQGQGIWRCGAQGNSFSDRPCADGQVLPRPMPPSALAVQQATEVARREAALAQRLRADRLAQDQQFQRAQASLQRTARQASKDHQAAPVSHARTLTGAKASKAGKDKTPATGHAPLRVATAPR